MKTWRLIIDGAAGAARNMAVDEAISAAVREGKAPPTLRLYGWERPALTLGYFQRIGQAVDLQYCAAESIDVVRRRTGGRAILHVPEELTYSFSSPFTPPFDATDLHETYSILSGAFLAAFRSLGIDASLAPGRRRRERPARNPVCFQALSFSEAAVAGRKVIGSAQKRWPDGLMQQGSIPLAIDHSRLYRALRFEREEQRQEALGQAGKSMAGLREFRPELTREMLISAIRSGFEESFKVLLDEQTLSRDEDSAAGELLTDRYGSEQWNHRR